MRLTTARYYTPNNRSIQASGIFPDIVITQDVPDEFKGRDEILGEAALPGQIGGGTRGQCDGRLVGLRARRQDARHPAPVRAPADQRRGDQRGLPAQARSLIWCYHVIETGRLIRRPV